MLHNRLQTGTSTRALLAAITLGVIAAASAAQAQELSDEQMAQLQERVQEMVQRLELTDDQLAALEPIIRESMESRRAIMESYGLGDGQRPSPRKLRGMRGEMQEVQEATQAEVSEILSDEQMDEYLAIQEERRDEMRAEMRSRMNR